MDFHKLRGGIYNIECLGYINSRHEKDVYLEKIPYHVRMTHSETRRRSEV